jgi:hypothetical protein
MPDRHRGRVVPALALAALAVAANLVTTGEASAGSGDTASRFDPGINSAAALASPSCDATRKQIRHYYFAAPPCVKPWKDGDDNGGATAQGVRRDSVKVVVLQNSPVPDPPKVSANFVLNQATGKTGSPIDAVLDYDAVYRHTYETWGRTVEYEFVQSSGSDETAQRADALAVAAKKPFAVLDIASLEGSSGGGAIFQRTVADKGVPIVIPAAASNPQNPYIPYMLPMAEFLGKALVDRKAAFAGQDDLRTKTRKFAVVSQGAGLGTAAMDIDIFKDEFAKHGGKTVVDLEYNPGTGDDDRNTKAQEQAPTLATRLKQSGATTVVLFVDPRAMLPALLTQMTAQQYFPENIITTFGFQDISFYGRVMDPEQWKHAFGLVWFPPFVQGYADPIKASFEWYWGKDQGTFCTCVFATVGPIYAGIHLAGPNLTEKTFAGAFANSPPRGGYYSDSVTTLENAPVKPGQPNPSGRGYALGWWEPEVTGPTQLQGVVGQGVTMYLSGGKRYVYGHFPKFARGEQPKFFEESASIYQLDTVPAGDALPDYQCDDCPSNGRGPSPSQQG